MLAANFRFQSTRPVRGATVSRFRVGPALEISIHAPRAGRDLLAPGGGFAVSVFQSTRPVRGATAGLGRRGHLRQISIHAPRAGRDSSPCPVPRKRPISIHAPRAGRDGPAGAYGNIADISIHAPRAGRDVSAAYLRVLDLSISIHAPRAGRDPARASFSSAMWVFQSTRPVRGATAKVYKITLHTFATKGNS